MTFAEKLKHFHDYSKIKLTEYRSLQKEIKYFITSGAIVTNEQIVEQNRRFTEFQRALTEYNELLLYVKSNNIPLNSSILNN
jgi:hypothetical protein